MKPWYRQPWRATEYMVLIIIAAVAAITWVVAQ